VGLSRVSHLLSHTQAHAMHNNSIYVLLLLSLLLSPSLLYVCFIVQCYGPSWSFIVMYRRHIDVHTAGRAPFGAHAHTRLLVRAHVCVYVPPSQSGKCTPTDRLWTAMPTPLPPTFAVRWLHKHVMQNTADPFASTAAAESRQIAFFFL